MQGNNYLTNCETCQQHWCYRSSFD